MIKIAAKPTSTVRKTNKQADQVNKIGCFQQKKAH